MKQNAHISDIMKWLYDHGGPVLRLRMFKELDYRIDGEEELIQSVTSLSETKFWTEQLKISCDLHGSHCSKLENIAGKFYELGLGGYRYLFDPYIEKWLRKANELLECDDFFADYTRTMLLYCLKVFGYNHADIDSLCAIRIENLYRFCSQMDYDIYLPENYFDDLPSSRSGNPLIKPGIYQNGAVGLPSVYDLLWFPYYDQYKEKTDTVMKYVFSPQYHKLKHGYGNIRKGHGHYYGMGWSLHIPGFPDPGILNSPENGRELLLYLDRLIHFSFISESDWFEKILAYLNTFRTDKGTWKFPAYWMEEYGRRGGYYCLGYHMGLGEARKKREWTESESTFRMLKIMKAIENKGVK